MSATSSPEPVICSVLAHLALPVTTLVIAVTAGLGGECPVLRRRASVQAGSTVLVTAAAGGTGIATTQLALAMGARVLAAAGGPAKVALCADQGADVTIDYLLGDLTAAVLEATGGRGVDVAVDSVGGDVFGQSLDSLAFEGKMVAIGTTGGSQPPLDPMQLAARNVSVVGLSWGSAYPQRLPEAVQNAYEQLFELHRRGRVRPLVSRTVTLDRAAEALSTLADRSSVGKLVVTFEPASGGVSGNFRLWPAPRRA